MDQFKEGDRVVVIGAAKDTYWYADRIGETFTISKVIGDGLVFLIEEEPCHYLMESDILLEEDEEEDEKVVDTASQSATIIFDPEQIREAAMMVSELNVILELTADQVEDRIYDIIKTRAAYGSPQVGAIATIGLHIRFAAFGENATVVEVTVDPSMGKDATFITATLDSNGNLTAQYPNR